MANAAARRGIPRQSKSGRRQLAELVADATSFGAEEFDRLIPPPADAVLIRGRYRTESGKRKAENSYMTGRRTAAPSVSPRLQSPARLDDFGDQDDSEGEEELNRMGLPSELPDDAFADLADDVVWTSAQATLPTVSKGKQKATVEDLTAEEAQSSSAEQEKRRSKTQVNYFPLLQLSDLLIEQFLHFMSRPTT